MRRSHSGTAYDRPVDASPPSPQNIQNQARPLSRNCPNLPKAMMKERTVRIFCKNNQQYYDIPAGSTLEDLYPLTNLDMPYGPVSAKVNNKVEGLHFVFFNNKDVEFLDITSASGLRTYTRSLFFVLYKAVSDLYPNSRLRIDTPVSNGYYCRLQIGHEVTEEDVGRLRLEMHRIVARKLPFHRVTCHTNEAIELFKREGRTNKVKLLESTGLLYTTYYTLDGLPDYYYGSLLTNTEQIYMFDIIKFADGILLRLPDPENPSQLRPMVPQPKMLEVFDDHHRWQNILGISTIGEFNEACAKGATNELINVSEALQEKKISAIADRIASDPRRRVILISGPSSSGKTTFSKRLSVQLMACGLWPMPISLDDYFVDRDKTPLDAQGEYDFENIEALNIPLLTQHINALLQGEEVELPRYNFQTGRSEKSGKRVRLENHQILLLEGIHALNPALTADIDDSCKFKIYASALTTILLDDHNYIPTTDNRLLRRIVRDYKYRGYSALDTIRRWKSVRQGEEKWIFPYQENADAMFNSALLFELAALRQQALNLLEQVPESEPEYSEAYRLRKFLQYLKPISTKGLPPTSLLREFLGGSTFKY